MPFRRLFVIALLALPHGGARSDDIIYDYSGDVLPYDPSEGWIVANPCEGSCTELIEDGRFVLFWPIPGDRATYGRFIAVAPEQPPPTLWVEWRFRSNYEFTGLNAGCDVTLNILYGFMLDGVDILGDAVISRSGDDGVAGLAINEFHIYRFESLDTGRNYWFGVDGLVFLIDTDNTPSTTHSILFSGTGGCSGDSFVNKRQEWDYIRYGTISFGEQIIAADPPAGLLDATPSTGLDRFTVTFDSPNYVYLDDITVEVTGGIAPAVTQTQRGDDTDPAKVEIVLDAPMPLNETTRFTFDDGVAVNLVEYTLVPIGACCFPGGSCEQRIDTDCALAGGIFLDGPCEGDADGDGIDGRCAGACCLSSGSCQDLGIFDCDSAGGSFLGGACEGDADGDGIDGVCGDPCPNDAPDDSDGDGVCDSDDPCPNDNPDDTDGDGVCDSNDPCPIDNPDDSDGDGVCDSDDPCPNDNPDDTDGDGVCDSNDPCPIDNPDDSDGDGVCDSDDPCPNDNPDDTDGDGVCNSNDPCPIDNPDDTDNDGVCDSVDACPGFDDNLDTDGDTIPDCFDQCPGADDAVYAPECTIAIPTTTAWGVAILALLLLTLAKLFVSPARKPCNSSAP